MKLKYSTHPPKQPHIFPFELLLGNIKLECRRYNSKLWQGCDNKVEQRPPKPRLFQSSKFGNALTGWHVAHETLIKVYSEHLLPAFWNSHFRKGTERNHLIGMRALYIIRTNDSVRCHRQHKVDLMPPAREISPKTGCMLPIISRQKRQTIRVWRKYDGLQWRVWKESQGRER